MKRTPLKRSSKPLKKTRLKKISTDQRRKNIEIGERINSLGLFFLKIWGRRRHFCESCGNWLGSEPATYMFDHLLEKSKYPDLEYDENNIFLCCWDCHSVKNNGHPTEKHADATTSYQYKIKSII